MPTPRERGFAMPPEWAPHDRCWMAWPCRPERWGDKMAAARQAYSDLAKTIARFEPVTMLARPEVTAEASLHSGHGISVLPMAYDDSWLRDTAPTFVIDAAGALAGVDWQFDGYGGRAPTFADDQRLAEAICTRLEVERLVAPVVLEGGAIHVDGEGTCLVCASSALDPARNPGLGRAEIETALADQLGIQTVIWLEHGLLDDETGGHVDWVARFVRPGVVLAATCRDPQDPEHARLQDNLERLRAARDAQGRELEVLEIAQPAARLRENGRRITMSYVDFYLANGAAIIPMFDDDMDDAAERVIASAFSDRQVVQIDASDLVLGGGGIHRATQQQPKPHAPESA